MSVTLATIYGNVLKDLGVNSSDTLWIARATRWLNKALDKAQATNPNAEFMQNSNTYISTVDGQATYSLPTDFLSLKHLRDDTSATEIDILSHEVFDDKHLDPSSESEGPPIECTLEFDISSGVHILRLAPIPDAVYVLYATMITFHPALSGAQSLMYSKLETALEDWAIWEGSLVTHPDNEFAQFRMELKSRANESMAMWSGLMNMQKPHPQTIPVKMKKNTYA